MERSHSMASRFQGRDYQTLRQEIIDFVKDRAPETWDSNNIADPMIVFIESIAMLGDNLHYYIDAMRREADLATASLSSSIYSYALREGYTLLLPRSTHFRANLYSTEDNVIEGVVLNKFDFFTLPNSDRKYYVLTPVPTTSIYSSYPQTEESEEGEVIVEPLEIELVAGELKEARFSFSDIDYYSRIELPDSRIDPDMCQLIAISGQSSVELLRVEDVISDLAQVNVYSLLPSFVNGVERLYIEFPYNYRNLFPTNTQFYFRYLSIREEQKPNESFESLSYPGLVASVTYSGGYHAFELPESVKQNYKYFVRDFSSLVTKEDYKSYVLYNINSRCQVFDKSDQYTGSFVNIPVRTIYIVSDLDYSSREELREDILKRSSRSDNIFMIPYGKKLYRIFVIAEANLMSESEEGIRSTILSSIEEYYNNITEIRNPAESVIYHRVHSSSPSVARAWVILISEYYEEGGVQYSNFPTEDILLDSDKLEFSLNNKIFKFFYDLLPEDPSTGEKDLEYLDRYSELSLSRDQVIYRDSLTVLVQDLMYLKGDHSQNRASYEYKYPTTLPYSDVTENLDLVSRESESYYDSPSIDTLSVNDSRYKETHFLVPSLYNTIVWVYST